MRMNRFGLVLLALFGCDLGLPDPFEADPETSTTSGHPTVSRTEPLVAPTEAQIKALTDALAAIRTLNEENYGSTQVKMPLQRNLTEWTAKHDVPAGLFMNRTDLTRKVGNNAAIDRDALQASLVEAQKRLEAEDSGIARLHPKAHIYAIGKAGVATYEFIIIDLKDKPVKLGSSLAGSTTLHGYLAHLDTSDGEEEDEPKGTEEEDEPKGPLFRVYKIGVHR